MKKPVPLVAGVVEKIRKALATPEPVANAFHKDYDDMFPKKDHSSNINLFEDHLTSYPKFMNDTIRATDSRTKSHIRRDLLLQYVSRGKVPVKLQRSGVFSKEKADALYPLFSEETLKVFSKPQSKRSRYVPNAVDLRKGQTKLERILMEKNLFSPNSSADVALFEYYRELMSKYPVILFFNSKQLLSSSDINWSKFQDEINSLNNLQMGRLWYESMLIENEHIFTNALKSLDGYDGSVVRHYNSVADWEQLSTKENPLSNKILSKIDYQVIKSASQEDGTNAKNEVQTTAIYCLMISGRSFIAAQDRLLSAINSNGEQFKLFAMRMDLKNRILRSSVIGELKSWKNVASFKAQTVRLKKQREHNIERFVSELVDFVASRKLLKAEKDVADVVYLSEDEPKN